MTTARQLAASSEAISLLREVFEGEDSYPALPAELLKRVRAVLRQVDGKAPITFGKWVTSKDGEMYSAPEYDSEHAAIQAVLVGPDLVDGQVFYVGQTVDPLDDPGPTEGWDPDWAFNVDKVVEVEAFEAECCFGGCGAKALLGHVKGGGICTPKGWDLVADDVCCPKPEHWTEVTESVEEGKS